MPSHGPLNDMWELQILPPKWYVLVFLSELESCRATVRRWGKEVEKKKKKVNTFGSNLGWGGGRKTWHWKLKFLFKEK